MFEPRADDRPPCADCRHSTQWRPEWLATSALATVCTHKSAKRINQGAVWLASLAREICRGRRWEAVRGR